METLPTFDPTAAVPIPFVESVSNGRDIILEYVAVETVKESTFGRLVMLGVQHLEAAVGNTAIAAITLESELAHEENLYIEKEMPSCKRFKDGSYVKSKALPATYMQARSVVVGTLEDGLSLVDENGNPLGKTALEKARKAHKAALAAEEAECTEDEDSEAGDSSEPEKSPEEKVRIVLDTLLKLLPQCANPNATRWSVVEALSVPTLAAVMGEAE